MANEITVEGTAVTPPRKPVGGLSGLQAGLLYGGAASTVMGPAGLLIGLGAGILANRMKKGELDKQAKYSAELRAEQEGFIGETDSELKSADPDEQRILNHARRLHTDGWFRLEQGDRSGRAMIAQANDIALSVMSADAQQRKQEESAQTQFQRGLISTSANDMRQQYLAHMTLAENVDQQAQRVLSLVAEPGFDPNKPVNKAALADMLAVGINGFYKDAPDMMDAISQGAGGLGTIIGAVGGIGGALAGGGVGNLVGGITTAIKSKDFKVTAEDYNRIALNMKNFNQQYTQASMSRLGDSAKNLDHFARQTGAIPQDYSLADYVSGGQKELKVIPAPKYTPPTASKPTTGMQKLQGATNSTEQRISEWIRKREQTGGLRPTN